MQFSPDNIYHVYNQGNNRETLFLKEDHYSRFLNLFKGYVLPHCEVLAWCLMPNHFHFMMYADERSAILKKQGGLLLDPVTNGFRNLLSTYSHEFNNQNNRSGALFRPKTKAKCLSEESLIMKTGYSFLDYYSTCFYYIHENPVKAGLVKSPGEWPWSSYNDYFGNENEKSFCNKSLALKFNLTNFDEFNADLINYIEY